MSLLPRRQVVDFKAQPSLNKMPVTELMRGTCPASRESIILIGQPGTGKTHLATAFGVKACQIGKKVRFYRVTDLITKMIEMRDERNLERFKRGMATLDLLILDEPGYVPETSVIFTNIAVKDRSFSLIFPTFEPEYKRGKMQSIRKFRNAYCQICCIRPLLAERYPIEFFE